jgi:hypothetical protein
MVRSVLKRLGCLALALLIGGLLGFSLAYVIENGWLESWEPVAATPEPVARLRQVDRDEVWVEGASGALYHNAAAHECTANCWAPVEALPPPPAPDGDELREVLTATCVRPPPLFGAVERLAECQRETWLDYNTVVARRGNGELVMWQFVSGGEYGFLLFPLGVIFGAATFFVVALLVVIVDAVVRWARRRRAA